jgi:hypothetical protein
MFVSYRSGLSCVLATVAAIVAFSTSANAQAVFCPPGFNLVNGFCTNPTGGAFSSSALSSQVIGAVQQSTAQQSADATVEAVSARRITETERCPDGMDRINGVCRRPESAAPPKRAKVKRGPTSEPVFKAEPVPVISQSRFAVWGQGFGDYESRSQIAFTNTSIGVGGGPVIGPVVPGPAGSIPLTIPIALSQRATTVGGIVGADWTRNSVFAGNDTLVAGLLTGYTSTHITLNSAYPGITPFSNPGVGISKVKITGPAVGAFFTYMNGAFSNDTTFRVDFLNVDESFTDALGFPTGVVTVSGSGSASLTNYTVASNFQYRFPLSSAVWFEPTGGFRYLASQYGSGAAFLGLSNGYDWRLQAGGRVGLETVWSSYRMTTTVTGLAYDDVKVSGGLVAGGTTVGTVLASDQGKIRGQGILVNTVNFGNGYSAFAQADVRGGSGLFGIGGRAGIRAQF